MDTSKLAATWGKKTKSMCLKKFTRQARHIQAPMALGTFVQIENWTVPSKCYKTILERQFLARRLGERAMTCTESQTGLLIPNDRLSKGWNPNNLGRHTQNFVKCKQVTKNQWYHIWSGKRNQSNQPPVAVIRFEHRAFIKSGCIWVELANWALQIP